MQRRAVDFYWTAERSSHFRAAGFAADRSRFLHTLNSTDWQIFLLYMFFVFAAGVTLRSKIKTGKDFFRPAEQCLR